MKQRIEVEMDDGSSFIVDTDGRDVRSLEAKTGESFLATDFSYTQISYLAGFAAMRSGNFDGTIEEFLERNVAVVGKSVEPLTPTSTARSLERPSRSQSAPASRTRSGSATRKR